MAYSARVTWLEKRSDFELTIDMRCPCASPSGTKEGKDHRVSIVSMQTRNITCRITSIDNYTTV